MELRWAWTLGHDVSIKLSPLGGGAGGWVQTVGCRLRLGGEERLPWQGAGWEQRLLAPRQLQIIPRHKQPSGGLWIQLGWAALARVGGRASGVGGRASPCPCRLRVSGTVTSLLVHTPSLRCIPCAHAHVLRHMVERRPRVTGAADGSSESRKQRGQGGGRSTGLNIPGFAPPGKPTLGLQLFSPAA